MLILKNLRGSDGLMAALDERSFSTSIILFVKVYLTFLSYSQAQLTATLYCTWLFHICKVYNGAARKITQVIITKDFIRASVS